MDHWNQERSPAQNIAGRAILLEIGARLGLLDAFLAQREIAVADVAKSTGVHLPFVSGYYAALANAGLAKPGRELSNEVTHYSAAPDLPKSINDVGYVLWGLMSCAPLINNAVAFARDMPSAADAHRRDGEHVARTSRWMGEQDFYPPAESAIIASKPKKIVDLGSGTCGLLIRCLKKLPEARGIGVDLSHDACVKARSIIQAADMAHRISVVEASIQSLIDNPAPVEGADVIHGGFVFHDLMPDEEAAMDALFRTFRKKAPNGTLVIVDAVPYAQGAGEQGFSAAFTFLHYYFMGRRFLNENEWKSKLLGAGYATVDVGQLGISGGRIFTARPA